MYLTADHSLAEDLTVETFERALRRWNRFDPRRGGASTWLCQLAHSAALDHFRSAARRLRREERYAVRELREVPGPTFGEGLSPELEHALAELSRAEREVVALRVVLELNGETASRVLGISPSACSTRPSASPELRERVLAVAARQEPRRPRRFTLPPLRRVALVAAPALVSVAVGGALVHGLVHSGKSAQTLAPEVKTVAGSSAGAGQAVPLPQRLVFSDRAPTEKQPFSTALPNTTTRLQQYGAFMRLQVKNLDALSDTTKRAMRFARLVGGYVAYVHY